MANKGSVDFNALKKRVKVAMNHVKADLVLKNANYVNVFTESIETGDIAIVDGYIVGIGTYHGKKEINCKNKIIAPALLDGHMHLESSMVSPRCFRDLVVPHGTCAVIADPHEITNVAGIEGLDYIYEMTEGLDLFVGIMAPSCVPSTPLDEAGAILTSKDIKPLYKRERILGLAEMMNAYGVTHEDKECLTKVADALSEDKFVDGHAPALSGNALNAYLSTNITTDHECVNINEALEKLSRGQWIEIREGTVCKDLSPLIDLFKAPYYERCMLVTDDNHPDTIVDYGHIDKIIRKAIKLGANPIKAIKMGSFNTAMHYNLKDYGAIGVGYLANFIILDDLKSFKISEVYLKGELVAKNHKPLKMYSAKSNTLSKTKYKKVYNSFNLRKVTAKDFAFKSKGKKLRAIELIPESIVSREKICDLVASKDYPYGVDVDRDIAKIAVVERHNNTGHIGLGFITGFKIKKGAIASSIGHDSHNIIVIGVNDEDMALAVNTVNKNNGGLSATCDGKVLGDLKLEVAGLMTEKKADYVIEKLDKLKSIAYNKFGMNKLHDPFMTLAFMQLPVIPDLKIIPKGLVDVKNQVIIDAIFNGGK
ncbi:MAG: adenine deaminase [Lachnospiraceae bacterium]|nr:adenine deaminase [Lachnospiraceae bacterium]MBR1844841.1 adenine deaminase [Lachnospiraceae bacterium]